MTIFHIHTWGWPRRRGDRDVQVCTKCGAERDSEIQFAVSGPTNSAGKRQHARNGADGRGGFRRRKDLRMVVLDGERVHLTEAARRLGMSASALHFRIVRRTGTSDYSDVDLRAIQVEVPKTRSGTWKSPSKF